MSLWQWIQENPVLFTTVFWPIFTALVSWGYTQLDAYPRAHAVFSLLAAAGFDGPRVLDAIKRLLSGAAAPQRAVELTVTVPGDTPIEHVHAVGENIPPLHATVVHEMKSHSTMFPKPPTSGKTGMVRMELMVASVFLIASGMLISFVTQFGCRQAGPALIPGLNLAACIADEVIVKRVSSLATIAIDCQSDVAAVVALLRASDDSRLHESPVYGEVLRLGVVFREED